MLKLYHSPRTRSMRIVWLLEELALPYDLEVVPFTPPLPPAKPFAQRTPFGKVPALEDGDVTMFESGAIVEYVLERYGKGRLAPTTRLSAPRWRAAPGEGAEPVAGEARGRERRVNTK